MPAIAIPLDIDDRPRTDDTHVAAQNVYELRQFVDAAETQEAPQRRYARIVPEFLRFAPFSLRIRVARKQGVEPVVGIA